MKHLREMGELAMFTDRVVTFTRKWVLFLVLAAALAIILCGCATTVETPVSRPVAAKDHLPTVPADVARCFNAALGDPEDKDLSVEEVERGWKSDRYQAAVMRKCGRRFLSWYTDLRTRWR